MQKQTKRRIIIAASSAFLFIAIVVGYGLYSFSHSSSDFDFSAVIQPIIQQASATTSDVIAIVPADDLANVGRGRSPRFLPPAVVERKKELAAFALSSVQAADEAKQREIPFVTNLNGIQLCVSGTPDHLVIISDKRRSATEFCNSAISKDLLTDFPEKKVVVMRSGAMLIIFPRPGK